MNGQRVANPPTAAAAPVATKRKSRRVGCSAEDAVVTIPNPFLTLQPVEPPRRTRPGGCRRPRPPRRQKTAFPGPTGEKNSPESFYWHPCRTSASPLSAGQRAMHEFRTEREFFQAFRIGLPQCKSRFSSPISPRTRGRFSGFALAWTWPPTSSNQQGLRYPTAISAGPAWTISIRSTGRATIPGPNSNNGASRAVIGCSCSPPKAQRHILIFAMLPRTSCCSGAKPQG